MEEYTREMYREDCQIANYFIKTNLKSKIQDSQVREELLIDMVERLYMYRGKHNPEKGTYMAYGMKICMNVYYNYLHVNNAQKRKINNETLSLDMPIDEDTTLKEIIGEYDDIDKNLERELFKSIIDTTIAKFKNPKMKNIVYGYMFCGKTFSEIGEELGVSRQFCQDYWLRFVAKAKEELQKQEYFD